MVKVIILGLHVYSVETYVRAKDATEWVWHQDEIEAPDENVAEQTIRSMYRNAGFELGESRVCELDGNCNPP